MHDPVNHPSHYTNGTIEPIDYIEAQKLGFHEAQVVKYITRWRMKNGLEDLMKAEWYLKRLIEQEEEKSWPSLEECAKPIMPSCIPGGIEYGRSPISAALADVRITASEAKRLNGAIPLNPSTLPPWELDGYKECGLDGRNCKADCSCGHPERGICSDEYFLGDFHRASRWMEKPWINE